MDENTEKDFTEEEQASEAETSSMEDTVNENKESENENPDNISPKPVKSKRLIQVPVLIAAAILVCALLVFGVFKLFFDNSVIGEWIIEGSVATTDEISEEDAAAVNTYYIFTDDLNENGEKIAKLRVGTMELLGTYNTASNSDGTQTLTVAISYIFNGTYNYTVSGNAFTGKVLTLEIESGDVSFNKVNAPNLKVDVSEDFDSGNEVVGKWNESDYNYTYTFNADGTANINEGGALTVDGTYLVNKDESKIVITYLAQEEITLELEYSLDGDTLVLNGLGYTRVTE